jgi:hypothetical protein
MHGIIGEGWGGVEEGGRYYVWLREAEGMGQFEGCTFTIISNMGLYVSVNVSFSCRPFFVRSYI